MYVFVFPLDVAIDLKVREWCSANCLGRWGYTLSKSQGGYDQVSAALESDDDSSLLKLQFSEHYTDLHTI